MLVPYAADFPIVRIDLEAKTHEAFNTPSDMRGSLAVSADDERAFLWSPRNYRGMIVEIHFGEDSARLVGGPIDGRLRGLPGGRFIRHTPAGFDLISIAD